jgi:ABC-type Mn2+/Zn2+ transport system permease subunit
MIVTVLMFVIKQFLFVSIDHEYAKLIGIRTRMYDTLFHFLLAIVIIAGVQIVGVILINALLIIPASIGKILARSIKELFMYSLGSSVLCVLGGTTASLILNTPTGASMAVFSGVLFLIIFGIKHLVPAHF